MINKTEHIRKLYQLYVANKATHQQVKELLSFLKDPSNDQLIKDEFFQMIYAVKDTFDEKQTDDLTLFWENMLKADQSLQTQWQQQVAVQGINETHPDSESYPIQPTSFLKKRIWAAASIIIVLGIGLYTWINNKNSPTTHSVTQTSEKITPGREGAILMLGDGRQIILDSLNNGLIESQSGSEAILKNGHLAYALTGKPTEKVVYNTVTTPKGRQFIVTLPDGTRVWLNAASSIYYPTVFNEQNRTVVVTGEVYMEVAPDKSKPFHVEVNDMEVQVLGTSFNINAYKDEPAIKTTLLEGKIKVLRKSEPDSGLIIKPGQQVAFDENIALDKLVDLEQVLAWKNGVFNFNGATLEEFMRQIARWYDLKVIYKGTISNKTFKGELGRDLQLAQVMKLLTQFNIKYQQTGNTITIESQ